MEKCMHGGNWVRLCKNDDCQHCFSRSIAASPRLSNFVCGPNGEDARMTMSGTNKKVTWKCFDCGHKFLMPGNDVKGGQFCRFCVSNGYSLCDDDDCNFCFFRSLASHPRSESFWESDNGDDVRQIPLGSKRVVSWYCGECKHTFSASVYHVIGNASTKATWCPICNGRTICNSSGCTSCYSKSALAHPFGRNLICGPEGESPRELLMQSNKKCRWRCPDCTHEWDAAPNTILGNGRRCPKCRNPTEKCVDDFLESCFPSHVHQWRKEWCKKVRPLPFDFAVFLPTATVVVETDGPQHFGVIDYWEKASPFKRVREHDLHKMECCLKNGIPMVRFLTRAAREKNENTWQTWLMHAIVTHAKVKDGKPPLVLQDHKLYRKMYEECIKNNPSVPLVVWLPMKVRKM